MSDVLARSGADRDTIVRLYRGFTAGAPAFADEAERLEEES
jgi:hypothetical protein